MSINTISKIKVRRGLQTALNGILLDLGELGFTTDTKKLYIGDGSTNYPLGQWTLVGDDLVYSDGNAINSVAPSAGDHLTNKTYVDKVGGHERYYFTEDTISLVPEGAQHVVHYENQLTMEAGASLQFEEYARLYFVDPDTVDGGDFT